MYASDVAIASFEELTAPLLSSGLGLTAALRTLETVVTAAVPSLLGWSLTIGVNGAGVTLMSVSPSATSVDVRASLSVPVSAFVSVGLSGGMVFYASAPYAFSRLTRDNVSTLGPALCLLRLDQDLNPDLASVVSGVRRRSTELLRVRASSALAVPVRRRIGARRVRGAVAGGRRDGVRLRSSASPPLEQPRGRQREANRVWGDWARKCLHSMVESAKHGLALSMRECHLLTR